MSDMEALVARAQEISSDAEVVTAAHLRKITLPHNAGVMGLITLDNGHDHTRPNTFGPRSLLALNDAIDAALADASIGSIGVTGKPFILAAGADLTSIAGGGPDAVRVVAELGHAVFRKLGEGGKLSFGFVNGLALGGGLEVALHCDYRTVMDSAPALGLPEVMLGLIPGWGGAWLVPNLVGAEKAVQVIVENPLNQGKTLTGRQAFEFGLADACFSGADYLEQSLLWAADILTGAVSVTRSEIDRGEAWDAAVAKGKGIADAKTGGASPAGERVHRHRQRLHHGPVLEAHGRRQVEHLGRVHREQLRGRPGGLEPHHLELVADVVSAVGARVALPAGDLRLEGDGIAGREARHAGRRLLDHARDLVALHHRVGRERVLAVIDVNVRAAHADTLHPDQHLAGRERRDGDVAEIDLARGRHDRLLHGSSSVPHLTYPT